MEWNRATPPDSRSLHGKPPLGDEASRGRSRHDTVVGKPVLVSSTREGGDRDSRLKTNVLLPLSQVPCRVYLLETLTVPGLGKFNTRIERPPSYSSADTEELVHRARAVMGPTVKKSSG